MSALLAPAKPHRIKATHRRRRRIASGRFVQRYYDPEIGRFLIPDPVGPEEDFINHFNRYNYAQNNPVRYTDPDGRWPGPTHYDISYSEAIRAEMTEWQAIRIAKATEKVDNGSKSWVPVLGDQSYHFNTSSDGSDSRLMHSESHFNKAVSYGRLSTQLVNIPGLGNISEKLMEMSLNELGTSLHPLQDKDAHTDEYSKIRSGVYYHDQPAFGTVDKADDVNNDPRRVENSHKTTFEVINRYLDALEF